MSEREERLQQELEKINTKNDANRPHAFRGDKHVCGLSGFGQSLDDYCPACDTPTCHICGKTYADGNHPNHFHVQEVISANQYKDLKEVALSLLERLEQSEGIVREFMEHCIVPDNAGDAEDDKGFTCEACGAFAFAGEESEMKHTKSCPYRRAVEFLEQDRETKR